MTADKQQQQHQRSRYRATVYISITKSSLLFSIY